jgi:hypothetical protein
MVMSLKDLNKRAEQTFDAVKRRKGWTNKIVAELSTESGSNEHAVKLQKMLDETPKTRVEVDDYVKHYDAKFSSAIIEPLAFIDSLELSANLSIAIACIISYKKKGNKAALIDAAGWIEKEVKNG